MRVRASDPFVPLFRCPPWQIDVFLNGAPQKGVVAADTDEGWIDVHVRDTNGRIERYDAGDGPRIARFHGVVELRKRQAA